MRTVVSYIALLAVIWGADANALTVDVYLLGGQSNASGRASRSGFDHKYHKYYKSFKGNNAIPEAERVMAVARSGAGPIRLGDAGFGLAGGNGPEVAAGYLLHEIYANDPALKDRRICIIKHALGGTSLNGDWRPNGRLSIAGDGASFRFFQETVSGGLELIQKKFPNATINIAGMMWHQGESDSGAGVGRQEYESLMVSLIKEVRALYSGGEPFPFVIGLLPKGARMTSERIVQAQKNAARETKNAIAVSTDGFAMNSDNLHYSAKGQEALGAAFANVLVGLGCTKGTTPWIKTTYKEPLLASVHLSFDGNLETGGKAVFDGPAQYSRNKKFGSAALLLDGSYILQANAFENVSQGSGMPHTMAFWFKRANKDEHSQLIGSDKQNSKPKNRIWYMEITANEQFRWLAFPEKNMRHATFENLPIDDTNWHHYAFIAGDHNGDGGINNMALYVDGKLVGTTGSRNIKTAFAALAIGGDFSFPSERAKGILDEFWLLPAALTADQIQKLMLTNEISE